MRAWLARRRLTRAAELERWRRLRLGQNECIELMTAQTRLRTGTR